MLIRDLLQLFDSGGVQGWGLGFRLIDFLKFFFSVGVAHIIASRDHILYLLKFFDSVGVAHTIVPYPT